MRWAEGGVLAEAREGRLVCVQRSVSWVSRGGQGNKSGQSGVMSFGWRAAVINTMLGSTSGHTFRSGKNKPADDLFLWSMVQFFKNCCLCDTPPPITHTHTLSYFSFRSFLPSFPFGTFSVCLFLSNYFPFHPLFSPPLFFHLLLSALSFSYFLLNVFTYPLFLSLFRFLPSFYSTLCFKTSPCPFSSPRRHRRLSPTVCVGLCLQTQQCPVQLQLLNI